MNRILLLLSISLLCCLPLSARPATIDTGITQIAGLNDPPVQLPPARKSPVKPKA